MGSSFLEGNGSILRSLLVLRNEGNHSRWHAKYVLQPTVLSYLWPKDFLGACRKLGHNLQCSGLISDGAGGPYGVLGIELQRCARQKILTCCAIAPTTTPPKTCVILGHTRSQWIHRDERQLLRFFPPILSITDILRKCFLNMLNVKTC